MYTQPLVNWGPQINQSIVFEDHPPHAAVYKLEYINLKKKKKKHEFLPKVQIGNRLAYTAYNSGIAVASRPTPKGKERSKKRCAERRRTNQTPGLAVSGRARAGHVPAEHAGASQTSGALLRCRLSYGFSLIWSHQTPGSGCSTQGDRQALPEFFLSVAWPVYALRL